MQIEDPPPGSQQGPSFGEPDVHQYRPGHESARSIFGTHNPWRNHRVENEDDDENNQDLGEGGFIQTRFQSRDGTFSFTTTRVGSPRARAAHEGPPADPIAPLLRNLDTIFHGIANTYTHQGPGAGQMNPGPFGATPPQQTGPAESTPTGNGGRNTFTATGRLWPRDANNAQPDAQPLGGMDE